MKQTNWYKDAIIYQIYPMSFKDSNNDGIGDIPGIISELPHLKELGVNAVWLSPVYDSPQKDNGYDISDYKNIYPPYGTLDDFKVMLNEMHKLGIRLIMDLVVNHTSDQHAWFKSAIASKDSPYRDYYIIKKGRKNGQLPPNKWSGFFGGGAWERIKDSDEYYLHLFTKEQPDLNWENPKLREEIKDILRFWLDLGVDGFRCDVITLLSKDQRYKNGFPLPLIRGHEYYINGPRLHEFLKELNNDVLINYDCMTVGETVLSNVKDAKKLVDPNAHELSMIFNFDHTDADNFLGAKWFKRKFNLKRLKRIFNKWQHALYNKGWNSLFFENHDQRRVVGRFNTDDTIYRKESSKMLATLYFFMQGTPFIYQGQEIGMTNARFKTRDEYRDVETFNILKTADKLPILGKLIKENITNVSRDNARTPMCWDDSLNAGFSKGTPWIRVNPNYKEINVKKDKLDDDSIFYYFKKLIEIRKNDPVIKNGYFKLLEKNNKKVFIYSRELDNVKYIVICSFFKKELKLRYLKDLLDKELLISNYKETDSIILKPYECRVYKIVK